MPQPGEEIYVGSLTGDVWTTTYHRPPVLGWLRNLQQAWHAAKESVAKTFDVYVPIQYRAEIEALIRGEMRATVQFSGKDYAIISKPLPMSAKNWVPTAQRTFIGPFNEVLNVHTDVDYSGRDALPQHVRYDGTEW